MSEQTTPPDHEVTDDQHEVAEAFRIALIAVAGEMQKALIAVGVPPVHAASAPALLMLELAAIRACRVRRLLLNGEPEVARWRQVSEEAFEAAVQATAAEMRMWGAAVPEPLAQADTTQEDVISA